MKNKSIVAVAALVGALCLQGSPALAGNHGKPTSAPFDGGISLLVAGGVAYGLKKARDARQKRESHLS